MDKDRLRELLKQVQDGQVEVDAALNALKSLPYHDLGFAKVDHHRSLRNGFPEVILGQGKTQEQIRDIMENIIKHNDNLLVTRVSEEVFVFIKKTLPQAKYHQLARCITIENKPLTKKLGSIVIVSAGTADLPVAEEAYVTATIMGNKVDKLYDVGVAGLHRLLDNQDKITKAQVVIVVAGMEGALASVVGGLVDKPVVAIPTSVGYGANFGGLSALLCMLNSCATGVGVVNIDNGFGGAALANSINSLTEVS